MAFLVSSLMVLVMLSSPIYSISCDLDLAKNLNLGNLETFRVLEQMGTISDLSCLENRTNFHLPKEKLDGNLLQKAQAMAVLKEILQQTLLLFLTEQSSIAWNQTLLDHLRAGLYGQQQDLDACLVKELEEEDWALGVEGPMLALKRYFLGIRLYLKQKKYTGCAWKVVTVEIRRCLLFTNKLIRKFRM
ncbi:PREDICTED: interferon omega-1-like [Condylura cristata]|uniref:interferon omega-1-like n=1 Tax=Condylura cristata TaxID=143302 RepID=UPI00033439E4|nr:PREDICTED: interferon omega-1-like [Condylura cristata]